jgi:hypothetical protein
LQVLTIGYLSFEFGKYIRNEKSNDIINDCYGVLNETISMITRYPKPHILHTAKCAIVGAGIFGSAGAMYGLFSKFNITDLKQPASIKNLELLARQRIQKLQVEKSDKVCKFF